MKITFLGTSCMIPTKDRNHTSILVSYRNENILMDCGENTQRQLRIAGISPTKITKILITHWHGDHVLGLPGLLQTMAASEYSKVLEIYGPIGTKMFLERIQMTYILRANLKIKVREIKKNGVFFDGKDFSLEAMKLKHGNTPCLGYSLVEGDRRRVDIDYTKEFGLVRHPLLGELQKGKSIRWKGKTIAVNKATYLIKGKKLSLILDTLLTDDCYKLAKNADILICEATYLDDFKERAKEYGHLTAKQAADIAKKSGAKKLILTHFSQRYKDVGRLRKEAKNTFENTVCAKDFLELSI